MSSGYVLRGVKRSGLAAHLYQVRFGFIPILRVYIITSGYKHKTYSQGGLTFFSSFLLGWSRLTVYFYTLSRSTSDNPRWSLCSSILR